MTPDDLLLSSFGWLGSCPKPEMDPLSDRDALQEAQLLDVRLDALRSTVGLLFELRGALQLRSGNTGALVARGVRSLEWSASSRETAQTAWTVGGSTATVQDGLWGLRLALWPAPGARLTLTAECAAFVVGDAEGLKGIPDYVEDDEPTVRAQLASWRSEFVPVSAVVRDAIFAGS